MQLRISSGGGGRDVSNSHFVIARIRTFEEDVYKLNIFIISLNSEFLMYNYRKSQIEIAAIWKQYKLLIDPIPPH